MKLHRKCLWFLPWCVAAIASSCTSKTAPSGPGIRLLTYSSLGSQGGFLESVKPEFEKASGCSLWVETTLGATQVLSYLDEEKQRARIDVVMGVDQLLFERAKSAFYLAEPPAPYPKESFIPILKDRLLPGFIPVDYGALSFIYRKADFKGKALPVNLSDLLKPEYKNKWIVQDPRASSPGMLFFLFADSTLVRVKDMKNQWATLAPSWDSSYKMFMAHDASMVWSYLTSLAYHASKGELDQYGYFDFKEGLPLQIEGMAVLNRVGNPYTTNPCLQKWVSFMLNPATQAKLVAKQYMMPVVQNVTLPKFFENVPALKKAAELDFSLDKVDHLISHFGKEIQGETL
jgi:thiamine transport system substrate-binding protein